MKLNQNHIYLAAIGIIGGWIFIQYGLETKPESDIVLYATREAPIGGESVTLFKNGVIQFGSYAFRKTPRYEGMYSISGDTIRITYSQPDSIERERYLVVKGKELQRESSRPFKIGINTIKK